MLSEAYRPQTFDEIVGHTEAKVILRDYLRDNPRGKSVIICGTPGIGKTTLVLTAAKTLGYEPLEINASRSLRSHEDVIKLSDSCKAPVSFTSILKYGNNPRKTCVILDEVDGSDPHAQRKLLDWIRDPTRAVPILCTANEMPIIFKRVPEHVILHRCIPLNARVLYENLPTHRSMQFEEFQKVVKDCQHDVRRIMNRFQYGQSDTLHQTPLTGDAIADLFKHQEMYYGKQPTYWDLGSTGT
jgi:replication-associated recombination protein RarA